MRAPVMVNLRTAAVVWLAVFACTVGVVRAALAEPVPAPRADVWVVLLEAAKKR